MEKNCLECNKILSVKPSQFNRKKYCSRECQHSYQKKNPLEHWKRLTKKVKIKCSYCKKEIYVKRCIVSKRNFCDKECMYNYRRKNKQNQHLRERVMINCEICNTPFEVVVSRKTTAKYCSRKCLGKANGKRGKVEYKKRVIVKCTGCNKDFDKKPSVVKNFNFCSVNCMSDYYSNSGLFSGVNSGTWQGGDIDYYGPNWRKQRRIARKRDNFTCQDCGITELEYGKELSVHHIIPFRNFEGDWKKANELSNLISLCEFPCHRKRHSGAYNVKEQFDFYVLSRR
ncbi:HNH endonuclease [Pseudalkalibacillus sp. Hm43]|uniref:HNH endonuclease n=1 Tax=Pseudalkalibacillus sp. Hm43 TaxID=3450742 RepID=UPI003F43834E